MTLRIAAALFATALGFGAACGAPPAPEPAIPSQADTHSDLHADDVAHVDAAIHAAGERLRALVQPDGSFLYEYRVAHFEPVDAYNIVRHAGAIYALAQLEQIFPDPENRAAIARATTFLLGAVRPLAQPPQAAAVFSMPHAGAVADDAVLGASGLGAVALIAADDLAPGSVPPATLAGLGNFLLYMQRADGSFASTFTPADGPTDRFQSLYYPGEAILGLELLAGHRGTTPDDAARWHAAALRGMTYLATSRASALKPADVPADNWALIATEVLLARGDLDPATRELLVRHGVQIAAANRATQDLDPTSALFGCFTPDGRTTPSSTRLEGLLAATAYLPPAELGAAIDAGIHFLLGSQLADGALPGDQRRKTVRIDYIQHALSALIRYRARSSAWNRAPS